MTRGGARSIALSLEEEARPRPSGVEGGLFGNTALPMRASTRRGQRHSPFRTTRRGGSTRRHPTQCGRRVARGNCGDPDRGLSPTARRTLRAGLPDAARTGRRAGRLRRNWARWNRDGRLADQRLFISDVYMLGAPTPLPPLDRPLEVNARPLTLQPDPGPVLSPIMSLYETIGEAQEERRS